MHPNRSAHVAQQQARGRLVHYHADVTADSDRPEIRVLRSVELVEAHAGTGRIELKVEGRGLDRLLLLASQLGQAVCEGIGDAELHVRALFSLPIRMQPKLGSRILSLLWPFLTSGEFRGSWQLSQQ